MNRERQEQLKKLADDLKRSQQYLGSQPKYIKEAADELLRLAGVEEERDKAVDEACRTIRACEIHEMGITAQRDAALAKLATYEAAMQRDRSPAWEKQLKDLSTELRSASEYSDASPKYISREDLQMASINLFEMATVYTHKCNFVGCKLALNEAKALLEDMIMTGEFGQDEQIRVVFANITATLQSLDATQP